MGYNESYYVATLGSIYIYIYIYIYIPFDHNTTHLYQALQFQGCNQEFPKGNEYQAGVWGKPPDTD